MAGAISCQYYCYISNSSPKVKASKRQIPSRVSRYFYTYALHHYCSLCVTLSLAASLTSIQTCPHQGISTLTAANGRGISTLTSVVHGVKSVRVKWALILIESCTPLCIGKRTPTVCYSKWLRLHRTVIVPQPSCVKILHCLLRYTCKNSFTVFPWDLTPCHVKEA